MNGNFLRVVSRLGAQSRRQVATSGALKNQSQQRVKKDISKIKHWQKVFQEDPDKPTYLLKGTSDKIWLTISYVLVGASLVVFAQNAKLLYEK